MKTSVISEEFRQRYLSNPKDPNAFEAKAMFQMRFYALTWWRMTGEIPRLLQLMYLGNRETLRYSPDEDDLLDRIEILIDHERMIDLNANVSLTVEDALPVEIQGF